MLQTLIISPISSSKNNNNIFRLFSVAKELGQVTDLLLLGYNIDNNFIAQLSEYSLISKIFIIDNCALSQILPENIAKQLSTIALNYSHVLMIDDSTGKALLPRIAGILEQGQISSVTAIKSSSCFSRFIYASNILIDVEVAYKIKFLTINTNYFAIYQLSPNLTITAETIKQDVANKINYISYNNQISDKITAVNTNVLFNNADNNTANNADVTRSYETQDSANVSLKHAAVIVSGGAAIGSRDAFNQYIRGLANKLGAGVGATRASVEAGHAPNSCQIGQTGISVAPDLYLAIGISGAIQHIAGIRAAKIVIAINQDRQAAIFQYADYGLVADLFTVIPELIIKI